jgi:DNA-binding NarL/FixJ family response regulator
MPVIHLQHKKPVALLSQKTLLSPREKDVVQLIAKGLRNREISMKLFISEHTVRNHLHNIFGELAVSDRLELALYAIHQP